MRPICDGLDKSSPYNTRATGVQIAVAVTGKVDNGNVVDVGTGTVALKPSQEQVRPTHVVLDAQAWVVVLEQTERS